MEPTVAPWEKLKVEAGSGAPNATGFANWAVLEVGLTAEAFAAAPIDEAPSPPHDDVNAPSFFVSN